MEKLSIKASNRDLKSSKPAKLRKEGVLPAVLYGNKIENQAISISAREFDKIFKKSGESTIINLLTDDGKTHPVLVHDVQYHYLTSEPTHIDFYEVSMTEKLKAMVALEFIGESPAVKSLGAILVKVLNEVEVECLPADLPHNIVVNLDNLKTLTDSIHIKDLTLPAKVKVLNEADELVAKVQPPRNVEAELSTPIVEDVSKVEGAAEEKPQAEAAKEEKK
jgi:large subunit ribosomal protein L25